MTQHVFQHGFESIARTRRRRRAGATAYPSHYHYRIDPFESPAAGPRLAKRLLAPPGPPWPPADGPGSLIPKESAPLFSSDMLIFPSLEVSSVSKLLIILSMSGVSLPSFFIWASICVKLSFDSSGAL